MSIKVMNGITDNMDLFVLSCKSKDCQSSSTVNKTSTAVDDKIEIFVNNIVSSYSTRCHLNLRRIAMEGMHVEFKKENNMINMKLRNPKTTATMWSSGKITCAGAKSETDSYKAARRYCRLLQKLGFKVKLTNYRIVNVLATCTVPFEVDIAKLANNNSKNCSYEPELHPGATYKIRELRATLKVFTTGSITLTAPCVDNIHKALEKAYPTLYDNRRVIVNDQEKHPPQSNANQQQQQNVQNLSNNNYSHNNSNRPLSHTQIPNHNNNNNNTNNHANSTTNQHNGINSTTYHNNNNNSHNYHHSNSINQNQYFTNYHYNHHHMHTNNSAATLLSNYSLTTNNFICTLNANQPNNNNSANKYRPCLISDDIDDEFLP